MNDYNEVWKAVLSLIKDQVTPVCYETWFLNPLKVKKIDNRLNMVYMDVNTTMDPEFFADIINSRYLTLLQDAFKEVLGTDYRIIVKSGLDVDNFVDNGDNSEKKPAKKTKKKSKDTLLAEKFLNPKYTFDNFVVGPSNSFAQAAAKAVAESPGIASNPLFIYGGSGLGKTHLIQAIGIRILENNPDTNLLYTSSENFLNEFVTAINENKMPEFKAKYRKVDVLIVDDIQFLEGKEGVQKAYEVFAERAKDAFLRAGEESGQYVDARTYALDMRQVSLWNAHAEQENYYIPMQADDRIMMVQVKIVNSDKKGIVTVDLKQMDDNLGRASAVFTVKDGHTEGFIRVADKENLERYQKIADKCSEAILEKTGKTADITCVYNQTLDISTFYKDQKTESNKELYLIAKSFIQSVEKEVHNYESEL